MKIKDEILDIILSTPTYFADIFLLVNNGEKVEVSPKALETQLKKRYKVAKTSLTIADYLRKKGFTDVQIFEKND
ncbi:hypothetical protein [Chryseobacterium indologenes]|uniref:hypothetical protein n=1 Tax=Chryseobacterium indologenes TaxID=253 RepID=UPI001626226C|nr:hypothetical protein [Chryseobacterium indologenes]